MWTGTMGRVVNTAGQATVFFYHLSVVLNNGEWCRSWLIGFREQIADKVALTECTDGASYETDADKRNDRVALIPGIVLGGWNRLRYGRRRNDSFRHD